MKHVATEMIPPPPAARRGESGATLIELLGAMVILLFVLVGVLQLFTVSLAVDRVAESQTEMAAKGRAIVEIIRLVRSTGQGGTSGILPLAAGTRVIPSDPLDTGYDFWGPAGFGVVEESARYRLAYEVVDGGADWIVSVWTVPAPEAEGGYIGRQPGKGVLYAARIPQ